MLQSISKESGHVYQNYVENLSNIESFPIWEEDNRTKI